MAVASESLSAPTLASLAKEALTDADGDTTAATKLLVDWLVTDKELLSEIIASIILDASNYRIEAAMRGERRAILRVVGAPPGRAEALALARGIRESMLDMPLANGVRLRDATRDQVQRQADIYTGFAKANARFARFYTLVAQSVPDGCRVGDVISDTRANELWNEVQE